MDWSPIWISMKTACTAIFFTFFLGIAAAGGVVRLRSEKLKGFLDGILTMPMVLPPTVAGFFLLLIFGQKRPVGRFLKSIGWAVVFNWRATVIAAVVISFPLMYRAARGAFEQVDENLAYAGRTLGMSEWSIFWRVVMPAALPGVLSGGILAFARGLGEFGATAMIAGNISGKTRTLPLAIYSAVAGGNMEEAYGYVGILLAFSFVIVVLMNVFAKSGVRRKRRTHGGRTGEGVPGHPVKAAREDAAASERLPSSGRLKEAASNPSKTGNGRENLSQEKQTDRPAPPVRLEADLHKHFDSFSLDVALRTEGEILGLLGASGCGKSMTLKCIAGIQRPDSGRIVMNGKVLFDSEKGINLSPQERRVGYLFQNYALFPNMTVEKNIAVGLRGKSREEKRERVREWIHSFHLEGLENHYPSQLSGGQQQRVALARILACDPDILMLDEPFSALDEFLKEQLQFELQRHLQSFRGAVLMVTHSRDEVYRFCRRAVIMSEGKKVDDGDTKELFRRPGTITTARLSGCKNISPARKTGAFTLWAEAWSAELTTALPVPDEVQAVGIRAHDFIPVRGVSSPAEAVPAGEALRGGFGAGTSAAGDISRQNSGPAGKAVGNIFRAAAADISEGPFETSIRMAVNGNAETDEDKYVWWKLDTPVWNREYKESFPAAFTVAPEKVMALK